MDNGCGVEPPPTFHVLLVRHIQHGFGNNPGLAVMVSPVVTDLIGNMISS